MIFKNISIVKYWLFILTVFTAYFNLGKTDLQPSSISTVTDRSCLSINTSPNLSFLSVGGIHRLFSFFVSYHQMPFGRHSTQNPFSEALLRSGHQGCLRQSYGAEAGGSSGCYWALQPMVSHWVFICYQTNQLLKTPAITVSTSTPNLLPQEVFFGDWQ